MKKFLVVLYIGVIMALGIIIPNMIANGVNVPIGIISVVGVLLIAMPFFVFGGGGNNGE
ncbi:MAG: hypothetical protein IJ948_03415 [Clostridia bacterium]|nr:hypothetical protein [Clostridia bacterium]